MGKELFSVNREGLAEGALATSAAVATAIYVKNKINKQKQEEASKLLEIFNRTLGTAGFPKPFNLDQANGEMGIRQELQEYALEQVAHGNPYKRTLYKVGYHLSSYNNHRKKTGDPIHSILCYLHYILLSQAGLMGLTGKDKDDFKKLEMFASFLEEFARMDGAKSRVSFVARILEIMPTQRQHGSQQALDQKEQDQDKGFRKSINAYTALQGIADSVNADADFSRLEELSRRFADSTLRLATMGVSSQKIHAPLTTALLNDIAVGTVVPAIEKKGLFSINESATVLPTDDNLGFIHTIQQVAASLEDFNYQSDTPFKLTDDQLKELIATKAFQSSEFNATDYSRTHSGTIQKTPLPEEKKLKLAHGYVAMLQLAQISADIARLAHYMNVHIRTESASSAAPFAFSTSSSSIATRKRCYEMMEHLKDKADDIYRKNAGPLIDHLQRTSVIDGIIRPQAAYTLAGKLGKFKGELDNAYKQVQQYNKLDQFEKSREQSQESIQKLEQEVSAVAKKYGIREKQLTALPSRIDYKDINAELTAHIQGLLKRFSSKSFIPLAQGTFGSLVSCEGRQITFDIQSDADLIRLEALAEEFIQQLESGNVKPKTIRPVLPSAMLGSVSGPDLAFGYMPQTSESPKARAQRIRDQLEEHKKGFRESTQRYATEAKPREETKITAAATQEEIARLNAKIFRLETANTRKQGVIDDTKKRLHESTSELGQINESLGAKISEMEEKDKQIQALIDESSESAEQAQKKLSDAEATITKVEEAREEDRARMKRHFESLQSKVDRLSKHLETRSLSILAELTALAGAIADRTTFNTFRDKYRDEHQRQIDSLKEFTHELKEMAKYYQESSEHVDELIENANLQIRQAKQTLSDLEKKLEDAYQKIQELSTQLAELNGVNKGLESANKELEAKLKTTQEQLKDKSTLATQPKAANTTAALSPSDNTRRTGNLFEIVVKALEKSEKNLAGTNKGKILELLRDDLQKHKENFMSDSDFKVMLKQVLGVACQHRGSDGGFAKNATTTGNFVINLIEADSLIRAVINPNNTTKKLDFERDILKGFLGVEDKKLRQDRTTTANLRNETKGNIFHAAFITDAGSVSRPEVGPEAPPLVAAAAS
ncbi:hypothetical protein [Piscirickettsia salmonis]|uniref:hypothetical protein n=1 Tax=Piscirickettsia salmonis TaxID=1238 RepID=UPI0007C94E7F|nr:Chromosome partition protein Smc [Piscirickettsiaceae bacterium NZ-RLO1]